MLEHCSLQYGKTSRIVDNTVDFISSRNFKGMYCKRDFYNLRNLFADIPFECYENVAVNYITLTKLTFMNFTTNDDTFR